ncbi:hypothetical protein FRC08_008559 [Ceratobasidium sp. 394]|nr:hypothetical protein FRC08_008559 [Ceratobasidium sp. 394]
MPPSGDRADVSPTAIHAIHAPPSRSRLPATSRQRPLVFWHRRHAQLPVARTSLYKRRPCHRPTSPLIILIHAVALSLVHAHRRGYSIYSQSLARPRRPFIRVSPSKQRARPGRAAHPYLSASALTLCLFHVAIGALLAPGAPVISEWLRRHEASRREKELDGSGQQRGRDTSVAGEPNATDATKSGGSVGRPAQHAGVEADVGERVVTAGERWSGKRDDARTGTV